MALKPSFNKYGLAAPSVHSSFKSYQSPVSGEVISSPAARRDDMKKHNCVDQRELKPTK